MGCEQCDGNLSPIETLAVDELRKKMDQNVNIPVLIFEVGRIDTEFLY